MRLQLRGRRKNLSSLYTRLALRSGYPVREHKLFILGKATTIELEQHYICEALVIRGGTFPGITRCKQGIDHSSMIETRPKAVKHGKFVDNSGRSGQINTHLAEGT